jgi:hypothetical protein
MGGMQSRESEETIRWNDIRTDDMTVSYNNKYNLTKDEKQLVETLESMFPSMNETEVNNNKTNINNNNNIKNKLVINNSNNSKLSESELPFITQEMYKSLVDSKTSDVPAQLGGNYDLAQLGGGNYDLNEDSSTSSTSTYTSSTNSEKKKPKSKYEKKEQKSKYYKEQPKYKGKGKYEKKAPVNNNDDGSDDDNVDEDNNADYSSSPEEETTQSGGRFNNDSVTDEVGYNNNITINTSDINMVSSTY